MITPYALQVEGLEDMFGIRSFEGKEGLSKSYVFRIVARADHELSHDVERLSLGRRARLVFQVDPSSVRAFHGVIAGVRVIGRRGKDACDYELKLVPRLWLLKKKRRTRIFQNLRVVDVVASVLGEAGIASRWQLQRTYPIREYCTQYEETDYDFVRRILAEAGIFFYFHQGGPSDFAPLASAAIGALSAAVPGAGGLAASIGPLLAGDSILCADDAVFYPALGDTSSIEATIATAVSEVLPASVPAGVAGAVASLAEAAAPVLHYMELENVTETLTDKVTRFEITDEVKPTAAAVRDFDPDRPLMKFTSSAVSNAPFGDEGLDMLESAAAQAVSALGGVASTIAGAATAALDSLVGKPPYLEVYDHHAPMLFPKWSQPSDEAPRLLRQERRRASVAFGTSGCTDLGPGRRFTLRGHPVSRLDQTFAVVRARHVGHVYADGGGEARRVYECDFECVPASVTYAPPRQKRTSVQVCLTAIVVGPEASEIHVDQKGQIKVQFHWDREGESNDRSSCWIRTMQPWAGPHWGVQFIPRVGMEVVVVFEGGDPDKPIVLGALNNATHPPAFVLPADKTRSGFRTSSSPGGKGYNELSFEDMFGKEQILVHAQRDLDEVVEHDHTLKVEHDEHLRIAGNRTDTVEKNVHVLVKGDRHEQIAGHQVEAVSGDSDERVTGMRTTRVEGKLQHTGRGDTNVECQGDVTLRTLGSVTTVVGQDDKPRSWVAHAAGIASLSGRKRLELRSDEELVIGVGKSSIRIAKDRVEISSAAVVVKGGGAGISASDDGIALSSKGDAKITVAKKFLLKTDGASMSLDKEVKVDGSKILLNSPDQAKDPPPAAPEPPTTVVLKDDDGTALSEQRYLITLDDGSQQSGMTDKDGKAELELKQGGTIVFPDLKMRGDVPKGAPQPYVVRQGDYFEKLAFKNGFDPDKVWDDPKNADLKKKRKDRNQLLPGDILYFAVSSKKPYPLSKGTSNEYRASVPKTKVQVFFKDTLDPFENAPYVIEGLPKAVEGKVGADGSVTIEAPVHVREVRIVFKDRGLVFPVHVGDMDPINETSGVRARLEHLGYLRASAEAGSEAESDERIVAAIKEFQRANGLAPDGQINQAFLDALEKAHGG